MFEKYVRKQKEKHVRFAAGMTAAVLMITLLSSDVVSAGGREPELRQYDWDCYSNDYYYSKLSTKEQQLYERLDAACGELLISSDADAAEYKLKGGSSCYGTKSVSSLGLNREQMKKVRDVFVYSNPQYYFLNGNLLIPDSTSCAIRIYDAFADGDDRAVATQKVLKKLEALQNRISDKGIPFETEAQIHDLVCDELTYMSGYDVQSDKTDPYYTQSIYGALISGKTLCAGYAKLYLLLCSYFGIDCISVSHIDEEKPENNHVWNQVRYGDNWYIVDVTWNDKRDRSKFFHISDQRMTETDQKSSHVPTGYYEGIRPVADTEFFEELKTMPGLAQPLVDVKDTAPGVTITMTAETGDVYYTLDGSIPDASDRYTQPIELTDSGTYIVTATTKAEGAISSAYEIFPVRIAAGRVSVTSVTNVSGKKVRVKFKSAKSYSGYEISYASKRDFSNQRSARTRDLSVMIQGLKRGKTYYIRVRGYKTDVYGNVYYTPYSMMKKVTITK